MAQIQSDNFMYNTRISSRNQTVVPAKVRKALKLNVGDTIFWRLIRLENSIKVIAEPKPISWANYTRGLGKQIWKNVDIKNYIKNLRQEWQ